MQFPKNVKIYWDIETALMTLVTSPKSDICEKVCILGSDEIDELSNII